MKTLKSIITSLFALLALGAFVVVSNALFLSAKPGLTVTGTSAESAPSIVPTLIPSIQLDKLEVTKISRFALNCTGISIAPDSEHYICLNLNGDAGLWLGSFRAGIGKKVADRSGSPAWLPDSKKFVYAEYVKKPGEPAPLYLVDTETGNQQQIGTSARGPHFQVNQNGAVFFVQNGQLYKWESSTQRASPIRWSQTTSAPTQVPPASNSAFNFGVYDTVFKISPDGKHIAIQRTFYESGTLLLTDIESGRVVTLTNQIGDLTEAFAWSPNSQRLAYSIRPLDTRIPEICIVNSDGSAATRILQGSWGTSYQHLTWMPDGQTLLFVLDPGGNSYDNGWTYMAIGSNGGAPKKLFTNGSGTRLFAGGHKMLFSRNSQDIGIWIADISW